MPSSLTGKGRHYPHLVGAVLKFVRQRLPQRQGHWRREAAVLPEWRVQCPDVTDTLEECQDQDRCHPSPSQNSCTPLPSHPDTPVASLLAESRRFQAAPGGNHEAVREEIVSNSWPLVRSTLVGRGTLGKQGRLRPHLCRGRRTCLHQLHSVVMVCYRLGLKELPFMLLLCLHLFTM